MSKGRILLVDNDADIRDSYSFLLEGEGYTVFLADSEDAAWRVLEVTHIDLVIVDVRLEDNEEPHDFSGIQFAKKLLNRFAIILFSAYAWTPEQLLPLPISVRRSRKDSPAALLVDIERLLRDEVLLPNEQLKIIPEGDLTIGDLVRQVRGLEKHYEMSRKAFEEEFEHDLLHRLFQAERQIRIFRLAPGRGGSGVLTVLPAYMDEEGKRLINGARVVVKFGMRESILREVANYQKYVERYVRMHSTQLVGQVVQTRHLAGVIFLFVGSVNGRSRSFLETYADPDVTSGDLTQIVTNIFRDSCQLWYLSAKVRWEPENEAHLDLLQSYRQQLSLEKPADWQELHFFVDCVLHEPADYPIRFVPEDGQQLGVIMGEDKHVLLHPVLFAENHADLFPRPRFWCLTHGDLNGRNIFVDDNNAAWLIDFFRTGWGPALRDAAELEAVVKFELLQTINLEHLILLEQCLLTVPSLVTSLILPAPLNANADIARAVSTIEAIRREVAIINEDDDPTEYYAHLFFYALKMISWQGFSQTDHSRYPIRQRHALYSAAKIAAMMAEKEQ